MVSAMRVPNTQATFGGQWKARRQACRSVTSAVTIRDNGRAFGGTFKAGVRAMGIRHRPTSFRSSWQNRYAERLIGSVRRECTDHLTVFNAEQAVAAVFEADPLPRKIGANVDDRVRKLETELPIAKAEGQSAVSHCH